MGRDAVHRHPLQPGAAAGLERKVAADVNRSSRVPRIGLTGTAALVVALLGVPGQAHDPIRSTVTWNGEVARLVKARCTTCHTAGGRGPMPLTTYDEARPWARAIREEVVTRRMPKWHAARGYGQFSNDRSLTPFEIALVVAWVDGGAARGKDKDEVKEEGGKKEEARKEEAQSPPGRYRARTLNCREQRLPSGRLVALTPHLDEGGSAGITLLLPDGRREVLAWIRGFERKFTETYWLRTPIDMPRGGRMRVETDGPCQLTLTLD